MDGFDQGSEQGGMKSHVAGISERDAMKLPHRRKFLHLAAGAAALPAVSIARAQAYPLRPVTFIVPWPAGSTTDVALRPLVAATENIWDSLSSTRTGRALAVRSLRRKWPKERDPMVTRSGKFP